MAMNATSGRPSTRFKPLTVIIASWIGILRSKPFSVTRNLEARQAPCMSHRRILRQASFKIIHGRPAFLLHCFLSQTQVIQSLRPPLPGQARVFLRTRYSQQFGLRGEAEETAHQGAWPGRGWSCVPRAFFRPVGGGRGDGLLGGDGQTPYPRIRISRIERYCRVEIGKRSAMIAQNIADNTPVVQGRIVTGINTKRAVEI